MKTFNNGNIMIENRADSSDSKPDKRVFNLNTDCPYFTKEQGDYFGKLSSSLRFYHFGEFTNPYRYNAILMDCFLHTRVYSI